MYSCITKGITVEVEPQYLPSQSSGDDDFFLYAYSIKITNNSPETIQLLRRHWLIRNGRGREEEVEGEGVVGKQPIIEPGETFRYASGCPLTTPTGNMRGTYLVKGADQKLFKIRVPLFFLRPTAEQPRTHIN